MTEPLIVIEQPISDPERPDAVWDNETQTIHRLEYSQPLKLCKRCDTEQPIDNFVRRVSINKALSLARASSARKGVSGEPLTAEPYHRNMTAVHAMCNSCAAKRRVALKTIRTPHTTTVKQLSVEDYDMELRLDGRYERPTPNPYAENPPYIMLREAMVMAYKDTLDARRALATRKSKKANVAPIYKDYTKQLYNEMQRIKMLCKTQRYAEDIDVQEFCKYYLLHLEAVREAVRKERYAANPVKPKGSLFKYIDYACEATKGALVYIKNLTSDDMERVAPRFIPTNLL